MEYDFSEFEISGFSTRLYEICKNDELDDLWYVFLNAGSGHFGAFVEHDNIHQYFQVNSTSQIELSQYLQHSTGVKAVPAVIITGSCIGYESNKGYVAYHIFRTKFFKAEILIIVPLILMVLNIESAIWEPY